MDSKFSGVLSDRGIFSYDLGWLHRRVSGNQVSFYTCEHPSGRAVLSVVGGKGTIEHKMLQFKTSENSIVDMLITCSVPTPQPKSEVSSSIWG